MNTIGPTQPTIGTTQPTIGTTPTNANVSVRQHRRLQLRLRLCHHQWTTSAKRASTWPINCQASITSSLNCQASITSSPNCQTFLFYFPTPLRLLSIRSVDQFLSLKATSSQQPHRSCQSTAAPSSPVQTTTTVLGRLAYFFSARSNRIITKLLRCTAVPASSPSFFAAPPCPHHRRVSSRQRQACFQAPQNRPQCYSRGCVFHVIINPCPSG
jgi:hypothetical protein